MLHSSLAHRSHGNQSPHFLKSSNSCHNFGKIRHVTHSRIIPTHSARNITVCSLWVDATPEPAVPQSQTSNSSRNHDPAFNSQLLVCFLLGTLPFPCSRNPNPKPETPNYKPTTLNPQLCNLHSTRSCLGATCSACRPSPTGNTQPSGEPRPCCSYVGWDRSRQSHYSSYTISEFRFKSPAIRRQTAHAHRKSECLKSIACRAP